MIGFNLGKPIVLSCCLALASFASASTAKADLHAEASYGYNWWGSTIVGGWVKNVSALPVDYSHTQGRRVQLWFYYPTSGTYHKVMDQLITDIPHGQTRAFQTAIDPNLVVEQPLPILYITPYFTDLNTNNDWTINTMWLGEFGP